MMIRFLTENRALSDSYFFAGHYGEAPLVTEDHCQRVLYIPQAENETIYSEKVHYEYDKQDVLIMTYHIRDTLDWEE